MVLSTNDVTRRPPLGHEHHYCVGVGWRANVVVGWIWSTPGYLHNGSFVSLVVVTRKAFLVGHHRFSFFLPRQPKLANRSNSLEVTELKLKEDEVIPLRHRR